MRIVTQTYSVKRHLFWSHEGKKEAGKRWGDGGGDYWEGEYLIGHLQYIWTHLKFCTFTNAWAIFL